MNLIVDTDVLFGIADPHDIHHKASLTLSKRLADSGNEVYVLPTTLGEFALIATHRIGVKETKRVLGEIANAGYNYLPVTNDITFDALSLYQQQTSKEESLFDCFIMAAAKKLHIDCIFSFDRGYKKNGFTLFSETGN